MPPSESAAIRERGEITIPKKVREAAAFEPGQEVSFLSLGEDAVVMVSKRLELEEARRRIRRILKQTKISAKTVLAGLSESRQEVFDKHYGKK